MERGDSSGHLLRASWLSRKLSHAVLSSTRRRLEPSEASPQSRGRRRFCKVQAEFNGLVVDSRAATLVSVRLRDWRSGRTCGLRCLAARIWTW